MKKLKSVIYVITSLFAVIIISIILGLYQDYKYLHRERVIPIPQSWQQTSKEDDLVRGFCLGTGSKCGSIRVNYFTGLAKEKALEDITLILKESGWTVRTQNPAYEELQISATQKDQYLFIAVSDDAARAIYEESHLEK